MDLPSTSQELSELVRELLTESQVVLNNYQLVTHQMMGVNIKISRVYEALERGVFDKLTSEDVSLME